MNALAEQSVHYVNRLSFEAATIRRQIEAVTAIDAAQGWALHGMWYAMVGDEASARTAFQSALQLTDDEGSHVNLSGSLAILGHFSEAQAQLAPFLRAEAGYLYKNLERGAQLGLFNLIADQLATLEARKTRPPKESAISGDEIKTASLILREAGLTDAAAGTHLDAMGEVLRRRRMPVPGISYQAVNVPETFVGVTMQAHIPTDAATVFEMNVELAQLMQDKGVPVHERFVVLFGGALP